MKKVFLFITILVSTNVFAAHHSKKKPTLVVTGSAVITTEKKNDDHCKLATTSATKQAFRICDRLVGKRPYGALKSCQYNEDGRVTQDLVFKCI